MSNSNGHFFVQNRIYLNGVVCRQQAIQRGIKLGQLASRLRVSKSSLSHYLSGRIAVDFALVSALAVILSVDAKHLVSKRKRSVQ